MLPVNSHPNPEKVSLKMLKMQAQAWLNPFTTEASFCVLSAMAFNTQKRALVVKGGPSLDVRLLKIDPHTEIIKKNK